MTPAGAVDLGASFRRAATGQNRTVSITHIGVPSCSSDAARKFLKYRIQNNPVYE